MSSGCHDRVDRTVFSAWLPDPDSLFPPGCCLHTGPLIASSPAVAQPPPLPQMIRQPTRAEVYLSWLIFPGAGQFVQRRWLPACHFSVLAAVACGILVGAVVQPFAVNLFIVTETCGYTFDDSFATCSLGKILGSLAFFLVPGYSMGSTSLGPTDDGCRRGNVWKL